MFQGLKVLELASVLAGPSVGQFFAELGADVIKVENLNVGGDVTRSWKAKGENTDDRSAYFCSVNWGKKSVALDLTSREGVQVVMKLAMRSDVIIASYKPGDAEKLGVDYSSISKIKSDIIYGQISGYGSHDQRVGYDAVLQAEAGYMFMNGEPGGNSLKMPVALIDVLAGHQLKEGLLLALLQHQKTGRGGLVEVSLLQSAISSLVNQATNWLMLGKLPQKQGSDHPNIAPYGDTFRTHDGIEILLAVGSDKQFQELCNLMNVIDLATDSRFMTNYKRVENRGELKKILAEQISNWPSQELVDQLFKRKIPGGVIRNLQQVFELPEARELVFNQGGLFGLRTFAGSTQISQASILPPPHFGEHTSSILAELT